MDHNNNHGDMSSHSSMDMNVNATHSPMTMNMNHGMVHMMMMKVSIRLLMLFLVQRRRLVGFDSETQIFVLLKRQATLAYTTLVDKCVVQLFNIHGVTRQVRSIEADFQTK